MSKNTAVIIVCALAALFLRDGQAQVTETTTTVANASTATTNTVTGTGSTTTVTGPTATSASTVSGTASTGSVSTATTAGPTNTSSIKSVGRCPVIPSAPYATINALNGRWYVMRYQPANSGPIKDMCDQLLINVNAQRNGEMSLSFIPSQNPSSVYTTEKASVQPSEIPGTFQYSLLGYGIPQTGYVTIIAHIANIGFIYNVCWLTDSRLQNLVLFATTSLNDDAYGQLRSQASYWENGWFLHSVNHNACAPL